jgi:hypothetical protein
LAREAPGGTQRRRPLPTEYGRRPTDTLKAGERRGWFKGIACICTFGAEQFVGQDDLEEADCGADGRADRGADDERGEVRLLGRGELEAV